MGRLSAVACPLQARHQSQPDQPLLLLSGNGADVLEPRPAPPGAMKNARSRAEQHPEHRFENLSWCIA